NPATRDVVIKGKQQQWMTVAAQIEREDPEAYEYLQGVRDMDRVGAGFIAVLASLLFAMFDLTASVLVLLGFLIFRWAVIAAPILGTVGLLRPASAGLRRLANAVVAAVFNIAIFGTGAAIYLFAVDLIM
ncbi:MFS transporter, partial [Micromonospora sp. BL1]